MMNSASSEIIKEHEDVWVKEEKQSIRELSPNLCYLKKIYFVKKNKKVVDFRILFVIY